MKERSGCLLFDWGDTLMKDFPEYKGPMYLWPNIELIDNAKPTLATLHRDWFIALATNARDSSKEEIQKSFARVDMLKYIDEVFCFKSVGYAKPSPQFFDVVLSNVRCDKSNIYMIGDGFQSDIEGAQNHGIKGVWLNMRSDKVVANENCRTIHNLSELPECLNSF